MLLIEVSLHLDIHFISIGTWGLFVNNVSLVYRAFRPELCHGDSSA